MASGKSYETAKSLPRCLVVHPHVSATGSTRTANAELEEAVGLAGAIELEIVSALLFTLKETKPRTYIGSGHAQQCRELAAEHHVDVIILNAQLSPSQQRNLEAATACKVIDRTALILEIFGKRARTNEGRLQVELAALNYQKSRLVRSWTHLERQRGGAGFMGGPGETQIETDRRLIAQRIIVIKQQLEKVVRTRELHRKTRRQTPLPLIALVGYTNAGKSTLFNRLTEANVMAEDLLFATLDPTIRAVTLPSGQKVLLSDTVGFIANLPHELVAAFRATLEEVQEANILLHIRDISHTDTAAQAADVTQVLESLLPESDTRPCLQVWNKIDAISTPDSLPEASLSSPPLCCSALTGEGCDGILAAIDRTLMQHYFMPQRFHIAPAQCGAALAWLHNYAVIEHHDTQEDGSSIVDARLRPEDTNRFKKLFKIK